jgi:hypothetical protein
MFVPFWVPTGPVSVSAFDVLMGAAKAPAVVKLPTVKDPIHTGIVYHHVVGVSLQREIEKKKFIHSRTNDLFLFTARRLVL